MNAAEYPAMLTVKQLRELYLKRELTPKKVIAQIMQRVEADRDMNIWITPPTLELVEPYMKRLDSLDPSKLPLWGIPFAIKDNIDMAGVPTTAACPEFTYTPAEHATVVARLVAAGAIPLGKTNLDQFATGLVGTRSPYGETTNALRKELISGGSSAGSAVAVARGQAAFALGTDTAGSGRVPAALNKLVGYKPSLGAWPVKGVVPACASLDCVTVFAHNLEDALAVDLIARGIDDSDPWSCSLPHPLPRVPQKLCIPKEPLDFFGPYANEYKNAWHAAVKKLKTLNLPLEYIDFDLFAQAAALLYEGPWVAERWAGLGHFVSTYPGAAFPVTEHVLRSGAAAELTAAAVFNAMHKLRSLKFEAGKILADAVLVLPTTGGTWSREQVRLNPYDTNRALGRFTNHCNLLDLCAIAVPAGDAALNTPFGVTLFALAENEDLLCGAASLFLNSMQKLGADPISVTAARDTTLVAVCGLHMRGYSLEQQMISLGARFVREAVTAAKYRFFKLPTVPAKPGLIKQLNGGGSISLEIWEIPTANLGALVAAIPQPLGIGKIELQGGKEVSGFICEAYAAATAEDITAAGSWRNIMK